MTKQYLFYDLGMQPLGFRKIRDFMTSLLREAVRLKRTAILPMLRQPTTNKNPSSKLYDPLNYLDLDNVYLYDADPSHHPLDWLIEANFDFSQLRKDQILTLNDTNQAKPSNRAHLIVYKPNKKTRFKSGIETHKIHNTAIYIPPSPQVQKLLRHGHEQITKCHHNAPYHDNKIQKQLEDLLLNEPLNFKRQNQGSMIAGSYVAVEACSENCPWEERTRKASFKPKTLEKHFGDWMPKNLVVYLITHKPEPYLQATQNRYTVLTHKDIPELRALAAGSEPDYLMVEAVETELLSRAPFKFFSSPERLRETSLMKHMSSRRRYMDPYFFCIRLRSKYMLLRKYMRLRSRYMRLCSKLKG